MTSYQKTFALGLLSLLALAVCCSEESQASDWHYGARHRVHHRVHVTECRGQHLGVVGQQRFPVIRHHSAYGFNVPHGDVPVGKRFSQDAMAPYEAGVLDQSLRIGIGDGRPADQP